MAKNKRPRRGVRLNAQGSHPRAPAIDDAPYELPDGWKWTTVRQIAKSIQYGYTAISSVETDGPHYLRITDIQSGKVDWSAVPRCEIAKDDVSKYLLKPGDIVFARSGATAGKSFLIRDCPESVFASYLIRVQTSPQVLPDYLYAFFNSKDYWDNLVTRGNAQPNANAQVLGNVAFPLPPLPEQQNIVARIESLFAESGTARDSLERLPTLFKRFRQSILASAFRGELTERNANDEPASALLGRIRAEHAGAILGSRLGQPHRAAPTNTVPAPDSADLPGLPDGWCWARLGEYSDYITKGESPKWQGYDYVENGVPFVRSENVLWGELKYSTAVKIPEKFHIKLGRSQLKPRDVLINLVGASIGRSAIVPSELKQANINQAVGLIRLNKSLSPEYLMHLLISPFIQDVINGVKADVARANFGLDDLRVLLIPVAPLAEQRRIVGKIKSLFAQADAIEQAVAIAQKRADKIDQSILTRAFRGEL